MQFTTKFAIGQRVHRYIMGRHVTFTVGQIRIETLKDLGVLIEYRANYSTGRNGPWICEGYLREAK